MRITKSWVRDAKRFLKAYANNLSCMTDEELREEHQRCFPASTWFGLSPQEIMGQLAFWSLDKWLPDRVIN